MTKHKSNELVMAQARGDAVLPAKGDNAKILLQDYIKEFERLEAEKDKAVSAQKEMLNRAKKDGFLKTSIRITVRRRKETVEQRNSRKEIEAEIETYTQMCADLPLFEVALA